MTANEERVVQAVAEAIRGLPLFDSNAEAANVIVRDVAEIRRDDTLPLIMVTPSQDRQDTELYSAFRETVLYPVQLSFVGASNKSQIVGRGFLQDWKEQCRILFNNKQPFAIPRTTLPDLYKIEVRGAAPLDRGAWKVHYNAQFLFVFVYLEQLLAEVFAPLP